MKGTSPVFHQSIVLPRRAAAAALSLLLASSLAAAGDGTASAAPARPSFPAAKSPHAKSASDWLNSQVTRGRIHNGQFDFDDWGLTIDTAFALAAAGGHPKTLRNMTSAIQHHYFKSYATFSGDKFAGAMAKSLVAAEVLGKSPRRFGGHNLRAQVLSLVAPGSEGFEAGRVRDTGDNDFSNTFAQAYAVIGLARSGTVPRRAVRYLLKQQCSAGYFRLTEVAGETCDQSGSASDVDATALAAQALQAALNRGGTGASVDEMRAAVAWLAKAQRENGSFSGGSTTRGPNSNSTGLAAQALAIFGRHRAVRSAARYVADLQITRARARAHHEAARDVGAIAYNKSALRNALRNGIQKVERDQFRRASAQAIFAFAPKSFAILLVR
jgi:hypothetical protein